LLTDINNHRFARGVVSSKQSHASSAHCCFFKKAFRALPMSPGNRCCSLQTHEKHNPYNTRKLVSKKGHPEKYRSNEVGRWT